MTSLFFFFFSSWVFMAGRLRAVIPVLYTTRHRSLCQSTQAHADPWLDAYIAAMVSSAPSRKFIHLQSGRSESHHKIVNCWALKSKKIMPSCLLKNITGNVDLAEQRQNSGVIGSFFYIGWHFLTCWDRMKQGHPLGTQARLVLTPLSDSGLWGRGTHLLWHGNSLWLHVNEI